MRLRLVLFLSSFVFFSLNQLVPKFHSSLVSLPYLSKSFTGVQLPRPPRVAVAVAVAAARKWKGLCLRARIMSSRRSRASESTDDEINNLIFKLLAVLPKSGSRSRRVQASKVLEETCNYIKRLHRDVDDLTERLSQLLSSVDNNRVDAEIIRNLLQR